ncbi:MAG: glycogen synthase [Dehalococcoidia bacterium]
MRVLLVAAEMSPLAKVGGLADVIGSLPHALNRTGHDARVILPLHAGIDTAARGFARVLADVPVQTPRGPELASLWQGVVDGLTVYLVEAMDLFERPQIYGEPDDNQRFLFFSDAVLAMVPELDWPVEVLHLHDWHTAFAAARLDADPAQPLAATGLLYTIHNLNFRGDFDTDFALANDLTIPQVAGIDRSVLLSAMALGIATADLISTVSPTYAREILTPEYGADLDALLRLRADDLSGITNGLDTELFDPSRDPHLAANFSARNSAPKREDKAVLQREAGLPVDPNIPLIGIVNRLFWQKGVDLAAGAIARVLEDTPLQFVVLGTGDREYEEQLAELARDFPENVRAIFDFNPPLGQRVYAGADLFLMPSRYEPCGLGQMIAMRYGAVPVVRRTGGLADTVVDDDASPGDGTGFQFEAADVDALDAALRRAIRAYRDRERWRAIMRRGMTRDFTWDEAATKYVRLYERVRERAQRR